MDPDTSAAEPETKSSDSGAVQESAASGSRVYGRREGSGSRGFRV